MFKCCSNTISRGNVDVASGTADNTEWPNVIIVLSSSENVYGKRHLIIDLTIIEAETNKKLNTNADRESERAQFKAKINRSIQIPYTVTKTSTHICLLLIIFYTSHESNDLQRANCESNKRHDTEHETATSIWVSAFCNVYVIQ